MTKIRSKDASHIQDRRGQGGGGGGGSGGFPFQIPGMGGSGGGGGGLPGLPGGLKAGGGILGIVVLLAAVLLPKLLGAGGGSGGLGGTSQAASVGSAASGECVTELEQIVCGVTNDVQEYWTRELPAAYSTNYQVTDTVWFTGGVGTGCGQASSETGPFYCPADSLVYIDLEFLQQLENMLIGGTSDLAEQYILAHEYGHHVQNLLGTNAQVQQASQSRPDLANQYSVALELQADCYAGAWVGDAAQRGLLDNANEIQEAIKAAEGVGDDRIQARSGRVNPETWTHGSAEQRKSWFMTGFNSLDPTTCDATFNEVG